MELIEQLANYLAYMGVGPLEGAEDGAIFYDTMPATPKNAIGLYATDVRTPGDDRGGAVQIVVRGGEDSGMWPHEKSSEIARLLNGAGDILFTIDGYYILGIALESGPGDVGLQGDATKLYSANYRIYYC